jgi:hypothetical protein
VKPSIWVITANGTPVAALYSDTRVNQAVIDKQAEYDTLQENRTGVRPTCYGERDVQVTVFAVAIIDGDHNAQ